MAGPDPWAAFNPQPAPDAANSLGRPVIVKAKEPPKPEFIPGAPGQVLGPDNTAVDIPGFKPGPPADKTTYRPMTPGEKTANHLSVDAPWQIGSTGEFKLPDGFKAAADKDKTLQIKDATDAADSLVLGVQKARKFITDGDIGPLNTATGGTGNIAKHLPWVTDASKLQGVIDQEIRGNIFLKRIGDLKQENDSPTGGTGIGRIMQAEIPLITGAIGTLDPGRLGRDETLNSLAQIERAALRSKARLNGQDPDDPAVQQQYHIPSLPGQAAPPTGAPPLGGGTPPAGPTGPDISPIVNGGGGDMGATLTPSGGGTHSVVDPKKQALGQQIVALVSKGADPNTIMGFAVGADPSLRGDPTFRAWVSQAIQYRQKHPGAKFSIDPGFYTTEVPLSGQEKVGNAVAQSAPGAALMEAGNTATFGHLGDTLGAPEATSRALAVAEAEHPMASVAGAMGGGAASALGIEALLGKLGMAAGPLRAAVADTAYGGITGGTNAPKGEGLQNTALGALLALGGNVAGRGISKGLGAGLEGVTNPAVSYAAREAPGGLTIGQAVGQSGVVGKAVKGVEDRLSGIPVVGDAINARRLEGLQKMNSAAFDKALEPVGGKAAGKFGEEAVQHAQDTVSQAFQKALGGKVASVDQGFIGDAAKAKAAIQALPPSVSKDVENHVDTAIRDYVDPNSLSISGENMQALLRDLQQVKKGYRNDPAGHRVGKAIDQMTDSVENLFRRQTPDVMPQYDAAKKAFKRVSTLEDAVLRAKNSSKDGQAIFTPAQLGLADRANTVAYGGKRAAAAGKGEFHDFQRNMQEVLPNKVPDSGTAGRLVLPALALGAGAGGGELSGNETTGLTLGGLIAAAYTRTGQRALTSAVLKRGASAQAAGQAVRKSARVVGHAAGTEAAMGAGRD